MIDDLVEQYKSDLRNVSPRVIALPPRHYQHLPVYGHQLPSGFWSFLAHGERVVTPNKKRVGLMLASIKYDPAQSSVTPLIFLSTSELISSGADPTTPALPINVLFLDVYFAMFDTHDAGILKFPIPYAPSNSLFASIWVSFDRIPPFGELPGAQSHDLVVWEFIEP